MAYEGRGGRPYLGQQELPLLWSAVKNLLSAKRTTFMRNRLSGTSLT